VYKLNILRYIFKLIIVDFLKDQKLLKKIALFANDSDPEPYSASRKVIRKITDLNILEELLNEVKDDSMLDVIRDQFRNTHIK
jgi:hypothetical protein